MQFKETCQVPISCLSKKKDGAEQPTDFRPIRPRLVQLLAPDSQAESGSCAKRYKIRRSDSWMILRSDPLK
jgi:hypothetical protein